MGSIVSLTEADFSHYRDSILEIEKLSFITPWGEEAFRGEIANRYSRLWAYIADNEVLGYICFWQILDEIHLLNLAVHPLRRKNALGTFLLNEMILVSLKDGGRIAWLEVRPSNKNALNLYMRAGFVEAGRRYRYYSDTGEDAIIMSLDLKALECNTPGRHHLQTDA
jgi:ribosomal-protein-alanine N-acetyltransferase